MLDFASLDMDVTLVLRRTLAPEASSMPAKIRQLPPSTDMAPSVAMHTIVSNPWICPRFCA